MSIRLTKQAKDILKSDATLNEEVARILDIKKESVYHFILRNSPRLVNYAIVTKIARTMGKSPDEVVESVSETAIPLSEM